MDRRKYREELLMECWQVIEGLLWIAPIWGGIIDAMILHDANKLLAKLEKEAGIKRKQRDYACTNTTEKRGAVNMEELPNPKLGDKGYMVDMRADATNCPPLA